MKLGLFTSVAVIQAASAVKFQIVHINDFHALVEGMDGFGRPCTPVFAEADCDGGWPKLFTAAKKIVADANAQNEQVIFVDAGDEFMGSVWSSKYRGVEAATFISKICGPVAEGGAGFAHCVSTFGNHEFDYGYEPLVSYAQNITAAGVKIISSNLADTCEGNALGSTFSTYEILDIDGRKVAFIAYITPATVGISSAPSCIKIADEAASVNDVIAEIKAADADVQTFIAIGHSGYKKDQEIAAQTTDVSLIIGGHSHTFLWDVNEEVPTLSGFRAAKQTPEGVYPTVVGDNVQIVQSYWGGRYLGHMALELGDDGKIVSSTAGQLLLGKASESSLAPEKYQFQEDEVALALVEELRRPLDAFASSVIGRSAGTLTADRSIIRSKESALGNYICDAMLRSFDNDNFKAKFGGAPELCLMNSGGIRLGIEQGDITLQDVFYVLPFGNVLSVLEITGEMVYLALEHATARQSPSTPGGGEWGQYGKDFSFEYDSTVQAACGLGDSQPLCTTGIAPTRVTAAYYRGELIPKDDSKKYMLVTNDFVARGGDGYSFLAEGKNIYSLGPNIEAVVADYIKIDTAANCSIAPKVECRIKDIANPDPSCLETTLSARNDRKTTFLGLGIAGSIVGGIALIFVGTKFFKRHEDSSIPESKVQVQNPRYEYEV